MTLTPEQINQLIQQADGLAPEEGSIYRALVKVTEAEVRKQDDALIRQLMAALDVATTPLARDRQEVLAAITAARARLEGKQ